LSLLSLIWMAGCPRASKTPLRWLLMFVAAAIWSLTTPRISFDAAAFCFSVSLLVAAKPRQRVGEEVELHLVA